MPTPRELLEPYLVGDARQNGDIDMTCPLHDDSRRSAVVNFKKRVYHCFRCGGGKLSELITAFPDWLPPALGGDAPSGGQPQDSRNRVLPTEERLDGYRSRLQSEPEALKFLQEQRGLKISTVIDRGLGYNTGTGKYVVPIYNADSELINVRYYKPGGKPKWVNTPGFGSPATLHPMDVIESSDDLVWCEGEFDSYITTQNGLPAFTATGGAKIVWQEEWYEILKGKRIILCFDADFEGRGARQRVLPHLKKCAESVQVATLPYKIESKHGKDLTDWWLNGGTAANFARLITSVKQQTPKSEFEEVSYDGLRKDSMKDKPVAVRATVAGVEGPYLQMPKRIEAVCTMDWKPNVCNFCPLGPKQKGGQHGYKVTPTDQLQLDLLYKRQEPEVLMKKHCGIPVKCPIVEMDWDSQAAWHGEVRNGSNISADALPVLMFTSQAPDMGTTVEFSGELKIQPKQASIFVAARIRKVDAELDNFQLSPDQVLEIRDYMGKLDADPRRALDQIALRTEDHVTHRFGQRWLHICADLVYHSILSFKFQEETVQRGWLELLAVGETRVGKSTTLKAMAEWYGYGEVVPCEKISIAGLVATSEKRSGSRGDNWTARIGKLPLLDRQLIVLDEAQGLHVDQIGQLSDARSAGLIKVTQASQIEVPARVRMIWLANPRSDGQSGIRALAELMGKTEDLARTDLPMWVTKSLSDVEQKRLDDPKFRDSPLLDRAVMKAIMYWAWSRQTRDVKWHPGSTARVLVIADRIADKYASRIPVMPTLEARVRVARLAVAVAARLFSTDVTGRYVRVLPKHVNAAGWVYANLFKNPDLEYETEVVDKQISDEAGRLHGKELRQLVKEEPWLKGILLMAAPTTRHVGQVLGTDSSYFLRRLSEWGALEPNGAAWFVPDWARKIAQETRR